MKTALIVVAAVAIPYLLHRLALGAEARGWITYRRGRRGGGAALGNALLEVQSLIEPSARYALEERLDEDAEADETGEPPVPGRIDPAEDR